MFGEYTKQIARVLVVLGAIISVFFFFKTVNEIKTGSVIGRTENPSNTITVSGKGEVLAVPDIANLSYLVTETGKTVAAAQKLATDRSNKAIAFLKEKGIAEKDITTQNYTSYPKYEYTNGACTQYGCQPGKQTLTGYEVSHSISVKIRNTEIAGDILSGLGTIGVQNLSGIDFSVDKPEDLQREARKKAIEEAEKNAEQLATDLGVKVVRIVSFSENGTGGSPVVFFSKAMAMDARAEAAPSPELPKGESKITSNVTIVYEIR